MTPSGRTVWAALVLVGLGSLLWAWSRWLGSDASSGSDRDALAVVTQPKADGPAAAHLHDPLAQTLVAQGVPLPAHEPPLPGQPLRADPARADTAVESLEVVPHVTRPGNIHREYVAPEVFEAFYADATDDEIILAQAHLESRVLLLIEDVVQERVGAGLIDEQEIIDLEKVSAEEIEERDRERGGWNDGLYHNVTSERLPNGLLIRKHTAIPWDQHVAVYDLQDEVYWLRRERRRRARAAQR